MATNTDKGREIDKNLQERLRTIRTGNFLFEDKNHNIHIDEETYIQTFKKMFDVKTLRTQTQNDNPEMYLYGNGYYIKGAETYFTETNHKLFETRMKKRINAELRQKLQAHSYVNTDYFEQFNPDYLNVQNGVLNLRTKELHPHDPKYRMRTILPVKYDPDEEYEFMTDFVEEIVIESDQKVIQEMFGDCLYPDYWLQKAFMLTGKGANGKGVLLYILNKLLGKENISTVNLVSLTNSKFSSSELHHKYANISNETPSGKLVSTDKFKSLRGGDLITAERKYGHPYQFTNHAKMIFAANELPVSADNTFAFWRSWIIIRFPNIFTGTHAKKNLKKELTSKENMPGILNYALEGLTRLLKNQEFSYSKSTKEVKDEWKKATDSTLLFIQTQVEEDAKGELSTKEIYDSYHRFCSEYLLKELSQLGFWKKWRKHTGKQFPDAEKKQYSGGGSGTYYWTGIKLKNNNS